MKTANNTAKRRRQAYEGFTLLEVLMVAAIVVILATIGAARYDQAMIRAHEAALTQDLSEMNKAIQNYTADKEAAPTSLDDLVQAQYLGKIPNDPITGTPDWTTGELRFARERRSNLNWHLQRAFLVRQSLALYEHAL